MTERAQALEAIDQMLSYMVVNAADRRVLSAEIRLAVYGPPPAGPTRQPDTGPPPPRPPVGSPTTEAVKGIVGKVWTHHDGVLPDGSVCLVSGVDARITERTAQLQAALFDEQAAHEATKCKLAAAEQSHEAAGNRVIELLKSTPVEPAGASESPSEALRELVADAQELGIYDSTGAPAPCVWREDGPTMATGCGVRNSMLPRNPIKQGWKACPYCKAPLNE